MVRRTVLLVMLLEWWWTGGCIVTSDDRSGVAAVGRSGVIEGGMQLQVAYIR